MKALEQNIEIISPKRQLSLFGYSDYFNLFIELFDKNKLPNSILLSGSRGLGKSTFVYHFINYLFSKNETQKYNAKNFQIDDNNSSYLHLNANTHHNFFLIENNTGEKEVKIEQVRNLQKFLNKSTYTKDLKIVLIDNIENLNLSSTNALLKAIEEPSNNTFFFIVHDSSKKIFDTIKSRCTEFKIFFSKKKKDEVFKNILKDYFELNEYSFLADSLSFDTPGNIIRYLVELKKSKINFGNNNQSIIFYFIERYKVEKNPVLLTYISLFIELYYHNLCISNPTYINNYFYNFKKILNEINNLKKFNLNEKNVFILIKNILKNEIR